MKEPTEEDIYRQQQIDLQNEYLEAITDPNKIEIFKEKMESYRVGSRVSSRWLLSTTLKKDKSTI